MRKFFSLIAITLLSFSFQRDATLNTSKVAIYIIGSDSTPDYTSMNGIVTLLEKNEIFFDVFFVGSN
jgi:hypothetical protein